METPLTMNMRPGREPLDLAGFERAGGYGAVRKALKEMTPEEVRERVAASKLRGRGGAGFPTGVKWGFLPPIAESRRPRYLVVNADEMEPGAFKDRYLLEGDPHRLVEGAILCAYAARADAAYVFLRWEYRRAAGLLERAIAEAYAAGYLGADILGSGWGLELHLHASAGRYICGEEDGLLDALEGKRPIPRSKPPFPQTCGLWGRPTVVNNVETVCCVPHIVLNGAEWFRSLSHSPDGGTKLYTASGRVKRPGIWELPMGTPLREIVEDHAGGMRAGYALRAVQPGGASTEFLPPERLDTPMDFDAVQKAGSRLGTGTAIVLDDRTCPVGATHSLEAFFARESCGWCTPCREGLPWIRDLLAAIERGEGEAGDPAILAEQCRALGPGRTFCALAPGAVEPLQSALDLFGDDFERHIREGRCPWEGGDGGHPR